MTLEATYRRRPVRRVVPTTFTAITRIPEGALTEIVEIIDGREGVPAEITSPVMTCKSIPSEVPDEEIPPQMAGTSGAHRRDDSPAPACTRCARDPRPSSGSEVIECQAALQAPRCSRVGKRCGQEGDRRDRADEITDAEMPGDG